MNATLMQRRHTDPVQLQVAGVSEWRVRGSLSGEGGFSLAQQLIQAAVCNLTVELCPVLALPAVEDG